MRYNFGMYIEFVIADNFLLTYLAGASAAKLSRIRVGVWRLMLAAAAGTVVAVFYPYMHVREWAQFLIKAAVYLTLCFVMYFKCRRPITAALLFLLCTFCLGGATYAVGLFYGVGEAAEFCKKCPLFIVLGTGAVCYEALRRVAKKVSVLRSRAPYEYIAEIEIFGIKMDFDAFLDTGNSVFDPLSGLPVMVVSASRFVDKLGEASAAEFMKNLPRLRKIDISTAAGNADAYLVKPCSVTVYTDKDRHKIDVMIGLVRSTAREVLIGPAAITEGI